MAETLGKKAAKKASGKKRVVLVKKPCKLKGGRVVLVRTLVSA